MSHRGRLVLPNSKLAGARHFRRPCSACAAHIYNIGRFPATAAPIGAFIRGVGRDTFGDELAGIIGLAVCITVWPQLLMQQITFRGISTTANYLCLVSRLVRWQRQKGAEKVGLGTERELIYPSMGWDGLHQSCKMQTTTWARTALSSSPTCTANQQQTI
jgi:hypothetical protein